MRENALADKAASPLFPLSLSLQKWLLSQTLVWLLKLALFFCFLESNQLVYENHLPLSGQQWLLHPSLCPQVEFRKYWSLPIPKGKKATEVLLLMCLSKVLLCLPSQESLQNGPSSLGNFQEGLKRQLLKFPFPLICSTLSPRRRDPSLW